MVKIISQNVRGLNNYCKRRDLFYHLCSKADIVCLQEMHTIEDTQKPWTNEWGGKAEWSNFTSESRGIAILVKKDCPLDILATDKDDQGRIMILQYKDGNEIFVLVNLYGPNEDDPNFFKQVFELLEGYEGKRIIMGDFNTILDCEQDRTSSNSYYKMKSLQILNQIVDNTMLIDVWRARNPGVKRYTWQKRLSRNRLAATRIDYVLIDQSIVSWCISEKILPDFNSDQIGHLDRNCSIFY